jgi:hypothetical protein
VHAGDSFNDVMSKLLRIHRNYQEKQQQLQGQQESDDGNSSNSGLLSLKLFWNALMSRIGSRSRLNLVAAAEKKQQQEQLCDRSSHI